MWTLHTANAEHWVPIQTVASFKRMREFQPKGLPWVVDALRTSEELEVDESGENVRRKTEVQELKDQFERSVYAVRVHIVYYPTLRLTTVTERLWFRDRRLAEETGRFL